MLACLCACLLRLAFAPVWLPCALACLPSITTWNLVRVSPLSVAASLSVGVVTTVVAEVSGSGRRKSVKPPVKKRHTTDTQMMEK